MDLEPAAQCAVFGYAFFSYRLLSEVVSHNHCLQTHHLLLQPRSQLAGDRSVLTWVALNESRISEHQEAYAPLAVSAETVNTKSVEYGKYMT